MQKSIKRLLLKEWTGQPVIEATLFSRSSKSLRLTFDLSSSKMWFRSSPCFFRVNLSTFLDIFP